MESQLGDFLEVRKKSACYAMNPEVLQMFTTTPLAPAAEHESAQGCGGIFQFSTDNPETRVNSPVLSVTRVKPAETA